MIKLVIYLKVSIMATAIAAAISTVDALGVPKEWQVLFDGVVVGWTLHAWGSSYTTGLVEPNETTSSTGYIHWFRTCHAVFNKGTAYFAHPSVWKLFTATREVRKGEGGKQQNEQQL